MILLIDINSVGHAANAGTKLSIGDKPVQAIIGSLKSVKTLLDRFPNHTPVVLWDGRAQFRYDLYPNYKNREGKNKKSDELRAMYKSQIKDIKLGLALLGVRQIVNKELEADDLAYHYAKKFSLADMKVVLATGDKDWLQLLDENVMWHDHRKGGTSIKFSELFENTGYSTTKAFVDGKALQGDTSDTIAGVGGIGPTGAMELMAIYGSVATIVERAKSGKLGKVPKQVMRLIDNETPPPKKSRKTGEIIAMPPVMDAFKRNMKLMDLSQSIQPDPTKTVIVSGKGDPIKFKEFCEDRLFNSIINSFDNWSDHFFAKKGK